MLIIQMRNNAIARIVKNMIKNVSISCYIVNLIYIKQKISLEVNKYIPLMRSPVKSNVFKPTGSSH